MKIIHKVEGLLGFTDKNLKLECFISPVKFEIKWVETSEKLKIQ